MIILSHKTKREVNMFTIVTHDNAKDEILSLPKELKGKMINLIEKLETFGQLRMPESKSLGDGLFELRVTDRNNIARTIYTYQKGNVIFILYSFVKKSQKTPSAAFKIARTRLKEILQDD